MTTERGLDENETFVGTSREETWRENPIVSLVKTNAKEREIEGGSGNVVGLETLVDLLGTSPSNAVTFLMSARTRSSLFIPGMAP